MRKVPHNASAPCFFLILLNYYYNRPAPESLSPGMDKLLFHENTEAMICRVYAHRFMCLTYLLYIPK